MPDIPTEAELDAMEARCRVATEGPWDTHTASSDWGFSHVVYLFRRGDDPLAPDSIPVAEFHSGGKVSCFKEARNDALNLRDNSNAAFAGHARTDLPRLIAACRETRKVLLLWANELCVHGGEDNCPEDDRCFSCQARALLGVTKEVGGE